MQITVTPEKGWKDSQHYSWDVCARIMSDLNSAGTFLAIVGRKEGHVACVLPPTVQILTPNVHCEGFRTWGIERTRLRKLGRENQVEKIR